MDEKRTVNYNDEFGKNRVAFTYYGAETLLKMAFENKCPDGNYGDSECIMYEEMKRIIKEYK